MQVRHALGWSWHASLSFMQLPVCHFLTYTSNDHPCSVQMLECSGPSNLHPPSSKMCTLLSNRDFLTSGELSQRERGELEQTHNAGSGMCYDGHREPARATGHYQSAYSTFIPRVRKHVCLLFMSSVYYFPIVLQYALHDFKPSRGTHLPSDTPQGWGIGLKPLTCQEIPGAYNTSYFSVSPPRGMSLNIIAFPPFFLILC